MFRKKAGAFVLAAVLAAGMIGSMAPVSAASYDNTVFYGFNDTTNAGLGGAAVINATKTETLSKPMYDYPEIDGYDFLYQAVSVIYRYGLKSDYETAGTSTGTYHKAYISGYSGKVSPTASITRGEVAQILYNLDNNVTYTKGTGFSDVLGSDWYYNAVMYCQTKGYVTGYTNGTFAPTAPISRSELASIIARYTGISTTAAGSKTFSDIKSTDWYYNAVTQMADKGWITGYSDGTFGALKDIIRAEAVTMINRALSRFVSSVPAGVANPFTDLSESYWAYANIIEAATDHYENEWYGSTGSTSSIVYNSGWTTGAVSNPYGKISTSYVTLTGTSVKSGSDASATVEYPPIDAGYAQYVFIGTDITVKNYYTTTGTNYGKFLIKAAQYPTVTHNTTVTDSSITSTPGWVVEGDTLELYYRVQNATAYALSQKSIYVSKSDIDDKAYNAYIKIYLDSYDEDVLGSRHCLAFDGITGDFKDYEYDSKNDILTVYLGDIDYGELMEFTVTTTVRRGNVGANPSTYSLGHIAEIRVSSKGYTDNVSADENTSGFVIGTSSNSFDGSYQIGHMLQVFRLFEW